MMVPAVAYWSPGGRRTAGGGGRNYFISGLKGGEEIEKKTASGQDYWGGYMDAIEAPQK